MTGWPAALWHKRPKPLNPVHDKAAGQAIFRKGDIFRSCVVIPKGPFMVYATGERWNQPGTSFYSSVPSPIIGEPFDTSKPRKGRWGETLGTTISENSALFDEAWDNMQISRIDREEIALEQARKDLQKRIEICLYGTPRVPELNLDICPVRKRKV